eukprot:scaffold5810_cov112-Isochrysis_galbana.AAC.5
MLSPRAFEGGVTRGRRCRRLSRQRLLRQRDVGRFARIHLLERAEAAVTVCQAKLCDSAVFQCENHPGHWGGEWRHAVLGLDFYFGPAQHVPCRRLIADGLAQKELTAVKHGSVGFTIDKNGAHPARPVRLRQLRECAMPRLINLRPLPPSPLLLLSLSLCVGAIRRVGAPGSVCRGAHLQRTPRPSRLGL